MRETENNIRNSDQYFCYKNGVIIYPIWSTIKTSWFLEVDATKRYPDLDKKRAIIRYPKALSRKNILRATDWNEARKKTLKYWRNKIEDENRKEVYRPE